MIANRYLPKLLHSSIKNLIIAPTTTTTTTSINSKFLHLSKRQYSTIIMSDEELKAHAAAAALTKGSPTIFDKIIRKEIPADILYEDEKCLAFHDIAKQAPVHFLVIPKNQITMLEESVETDDLILGHIMRIAGKLGKEKCPNGFRVVVNNGVEGCQSVYHLHLHVIGGRQLKWPAG